MFLHVVYILHLISQHTNQSFKINIWSDNSKISVIFDSVSDACSLCSNCFVCSFVGSGFLFVICLLFIIHCNFCWKLKMMYWAKEIAVNKLLVMVWYGMTCWKGKHSVVTWLGLIPLVNYVSGTKLHHTSQKKKIPSFPHMKKKHQYELDFGISFPLSGILEVAKKTGCSSTLSPSRWYFYLC